ncbi:alpha/beta hydrolase [Lusitaniella coriacea LEGE 07157]|uniref:Alpha/beta hydrolase n=1 Tax=Lusitaniella coriacea LEGE 07157 TaxID=945747 RepID=A0A8J7E292_9CYAN|nr:alpha/beta hydrolase [Lusitaniella coriacea]MBE9118346.1 alpha/beta hydrolase [Lusitaniella coriacea LEGE 07157]
MKRYLKKYGRAIAIAYLFLGTLLWIFQERLVFHPSSTLAHTPDLYELEYEEVWLPVWGTSAKLHGWWIPSKQPQTPVLLYLHHNAGNIGANVSQASAFQRLGYSVFLVDYRGFGQSEGNFPNETQVYEDAEIAWEYLTKTRKISPQEILIYGHSLGSAIAVNLAVQHPEARGLITHNALTSLRDMTKRFGVFYLFPIDLMLRQEFDSLTKIPSLEIPVLFIHGVRDPQIPAKMSQKLYDAAPEPKQLLLIPDAGHDNNMKEEDLQKVGQFLEQMVSSE